MIKIAYIVEGMYNSAGIERVISMRANELCCEFDVTITTLDDGQKPDFYTLDKRVKRIYLNADRNNIEDKLNDFLLTRQFDIVTSFCGMEFQYLPRIKDGSKKFLEFHFSWDISKVWCANIINPCVRQFAVAMQTLKRLFYARQYDCVFVLTNADKKWWKKYCKNVETIFNPITLDCPIQSDCKSKNVLAVGRLDYQKGFDYLIEAWSSVNKNHPDWKLSIVGDGDLRCDLERKIIDLNLSDSVELVGRVQDVVAYYSNSSIFVASSRTEGFSLALLEASACGLPLVSFDSPHGPSEIVKDGVNGLLINKVGDVIAMSDRICELIEDESKRVRMGQKARALSCRFDKQTVLDMWKHIYRKAISL